MDASELATLRRPRTFPAVSLVMPTHRRRMEAQQDRVKLKALLDQTRRRLDGLTLDRGVAEDVLDGLEKAAGQIDFEHLAEGLVLLAAPGGESHAFVLPRVTVTERVIIDDSFATRDLVAMLESSWKYWAVVLSEPTRLLDGEGERVSEVANALFPLEFDDSLPNMYGSAPRERRQFRMQDDQREQFFRQAERNLSEMLKQDDRPVILLGVPRNLAFFRATANGQAARAVIGAVEGGFDAASPAEIAQLVRPVLQEEHERAQRSALADLDDGRSAHRFVSGLDEIWELAGHGRIAHLVVEQGYFAPARTRDGRLFPADSSEGRPVNDAVDDLIEMVLSTDGRITFVLDGTLTAKERIAAVLRY